MDNKHGKNDRGVRRARMPLLTRRRFVKTVGAATAAVTTGFTAGTASAADLPRVKEDDPMAKALHYVHDARTVDAAKRFSDRYCNNCALYAGNAADEWAKCSVFPGKVVAGQGWCQVWAPKATS